MVNFTFTQIVNNKSVVNHLIKSYIVAMHKNIAYTSNVFLNFYLKTILFLFDQSVQTLGPGLRCYFTS